MRTINRGTLRKRRRARPLDFAAKTDRPNREKFNRKSDRLLGSAEVLTDPPASTPASIPASIPASPPASPHPTPAPVTRVARRSVHVGGRLKNERKPPIR